MVASLCERDLDLEGSFQQFGPPPHWQRAPGFPTLIQIILEQQVSLASARAVFDKLNALRGINNRLTPKRFLQLDDATLKGCGFSRQKARYSRLLAEAVINRAIVLEDLEQQEDDEVRQQLCALKGIGPWTADVYLLMALDRPDLWPIGDIALQEGVRLIKGLDKRPVGEDMLNIAEPWRPYRSVAARMVWHHYLCERANTPKLTDTPQRH